MAKYFKSIKSYDDLKNQYKKLLKANHPDKPLATVEYSPNNKKVLQCYGDHNSKPCDEIEHYVFFTWLPYANRQLKKIPA